MQLLANARTLISTRNYPEMRPQPVFTQSNRFVYENRKHTWLIGRILHDINDSYATRKFLRHTVEKKTWRFINKMSSAIYIGVPSTHLSVCLFFFLSFSLLLSFKQKKT